ncbi:ATP-binding cassette domain-containing protein [Gynuella sp.]|uniref:ATP-binding cassette domain-containing protein n=1 Tax=Gynuella sp. TaxID=2969146 RepID=UPI003D13CC30
MALITLDQVSLAYGSIPLLNQATLNIDSGERLCIVGRNGTGKSSLLKLLTGENVPDSGIIRIPQSTRIGYLQQTLPERLDVTVRTMVYNSDPELIELMNAWNLLIEQDPGSAEVDRLHHEIDVRGGWALDTSVNQVLSRLGLDGDVMVKDLSGGWRRRVLLAQALLRDPDVLLLDEPTNHLDIEAILWMEQFFSSYRGTVVFISHDRRFIDALATRIIELDRGQLTSFNGNYHDYLQLKAKLLEEEERQNQLFDKKLSQEEVWIRQGIKARRTRNEGRVRALKALREQRKQRIERQGKASLQISAADKSGKMVFEVEQLSFAYAENKVVENFSTLVERGDKIAFIGPNGVGKSTLIKLLLGELVPNTGQVKQGTKLEIAYFDQTQEHLDPERTVLDTVAEGNDQIVVNGVSKHIYSYLQDFLFSPDRARSPIKALSGGERNRVLLARLFTRPANLLILDEPTNDLDMETLELLEELLIDFPGTLLLVSHDREFVDAVATQTWVFEQQGKISEWVGGYSDWYRARAARKPAEVADASQKNVQKSDARKKAGPIKNRKLSYKLKVEYDELPNKIEQLEQRLTILQEEISQSDFYTRPQDEVQSTLAAMEETEQQLEAAMERWVELEDMQS